MAAINSCTLAKLPRRIRWLRRSRKNRSIMLSQEAPVRGCFLLQPLEELQPFAMHMPGHASTDHVAVQDVERGEQRARPMPFIVMRPRGQAPRCERKARLRAVQRPDLALFV